ncbi:MAG: FAD-binding domain-containing protein [Porticoccaceae bacterium]
MPIKQNLIQRAVSELSSSLRAIGVQLDVLTVNYYEQIPEHLVSYCRQQAISGIHANREYLINEIDRDQAVSTTGIPCHFYNDALLVPPENICNHSGQPYKVFTAFSKAWLSRIIHDLPTIQLLPEQTAIAGNNPIPSFAPEISEQLQYQLALWPSSADRALQALTRFTDSDSQSSVYDYHKSRDYPNLDATSRLSSAISIGLISVRQCLQQLLSKHGDACWDKSTGPGCWLNELIWREFYQHIAYHFPRVVRGQAFKEETDNIPWLYDDDRLKAWKHGLTGYPIIDAGMRQLSQTGWMHNRLRMLTASFLVKDLHLDWRLGEQHFMENLIDGDFAANNGGWQWAASTGTDAAPYFRVFNPTTQSRRFDPQGRFIRSFVPELSQCDSNEIYEPVRRDNYPPPVVNHNQARAEFISVFQNIQEQKNKQE